ncbi:MAG: hypothetical protein F6K62_02665 [Sphaerospermopsis sp. SIO1G2]|nr:hypothetical protein [Sphaerospermopsis sp. SIO1G2]
MSKKLVTIENMQNCCILKCQYYFYRKCLGGHDIGPNEKLYLVIRHLPWMESQGMIN